MSGLKSASVAVLCRYMMICNTNTTTEFRATHLTIAIAIAKHSLSSKLVDTVVISFF
jgi:hypothetical protein